MAPSPAPNSLFPRIGEPDDFSVARIQWLIRLRWIAIAGITVTTALAWLGAFPGVEWRVTGAAGVVAFAYNFVLWRSTSAGGACGHRAGVFQAVVDMLLLTVVLWSAGGVSNPFTAFYVFHVALVGVLGGPSATLKALGMAILCVAALALTHFVPALQIGTWAPLPPWGFITTNFAFVTTVGAIAYLTTHAMRELRAREAALVEARAREALEYQLLVKTLNELDAGLEVVADDGTVLWQNKRAEALAPALERASADNKGPEVEDENGVRRRTFAVASENHEYLYEQIAFPLSADDDARTMNLYVDRTQAMLQEGRLVLAERLVTLGRMAQGVAHELNTPLATIRTLASDMRAALRDVGEDPAARTKVVADVDESAKLIHDETRRLGRITQSLLAGGDLVQAKIDREVPVGTVVARARALVFAGANLGPDVTVAASLDRLNVSADQDRLMQVMVNLLQNAADATRERSPARIHVTGHEEGGTVVVEVEDNGTGLPADMEDRLFEPFVTTKPNGTGLGLYTSYMMVRRMGGTLSLEPAVTGGARAVLRLPASRPVANDASVRQRAG